MNALNRWEYGEGQVCYSDPAQESYRKAAAFLVDDVEDWGGGTGWARKYFTNYKNIDGSAHPGVDVQADIATYTSTTKNILLREALEYNENWKDILANAKSSFTEKLCLIISTPEADETHAGRYDPVYVDGQPTERMIPEMHFKRKDVLDEFPADTYRVTEETIQTNHLYGIDWILYIERI